MRSRRTPEFKILYHALPEPARKRAYHAYQLFRRDPFYSSLQFKRVGVLEPVFSVRIGIGYRALGLRDEPELIIWFWIGPHAAYDAIIKRF